VGVVEIGAVADEADDRPWVLAGRLGQRRADARREAVPEATALVREELPGRERPAPEERVL
jgi:hypothetical protein